MSFKIKNQKFKIMIFAIILITILNIKTISYATIRGDADKDSNVTAFDEYITLSESLNDTL